MNACAKSVFSNNNLDCMNTFNLHTTCCEFVVYFLSVFLLENIMCYCTIIAHAHTMYTNVVYMHIQCIQMWYHIQVLMIIVP